MNDLKQDSHNLKQESENDEYTESLQPNNLQELEPTPTEHCTIQKNGINISLGSGFVCVSELAGLGLQLFREISEPVEKKSMVGVS